MYCIAYKYKYFDDNTFWVLLTLSVQVKRYKRYLSHNFEDNEAGDGGWKINVRLEGGIWLPLVRYIWSERAKCICSPCPASLCICVPRTSVFVCAGHLYLLQAGSGSSDTDTAASNTIGLPHLHPSLYLYSRQICLSFFHVISRWVLKSETPLKEKA